MVNGLSGPLALLAVVSLAVISNSALVAPVHAQSANGYLVGTWFFFGTIGRNNGELLGSIPGVQQCVGIVLYHIDYLLKTLEPFWVLEPGYADRVALEIARHISFMADGTLMVTFQTRDPRYQVDPSPLETDYGYYTLSGNVLTLRFSNVVYQLGIDHATSNIFSAELLGYLVDSIGVFQRQ